MCSFSLSLSTQNATYSWPHPSQPQLWRGCQIWALGMTLGCGFFGGWGVSAASVRRWSRLELAASVWWGQAGWGGAGRHNRVQLEELVRHQRWGEQGSHSWPLPKSESMIMCSRNILNTEQRRQIGHFLHAMPYGLQKAAWSVPKKVS